MGMDEEKGMEEKIIHTIANVEYTYYVNTCVSDELRVRM